MHAHPGGQNPDWHSDNVTNHAAFWDHRDFQDRTVWLWTKIAERYKSNAWVAGYNPINEPCDGQHVRLPEFYQRISKAIREVDGDHILWLDGNTFAMEWRGFDAVIPNAVYSLHDYSSMGFPKGEPFRNTREQRQKLERQFLRKAEFMHQHKVPIWNGEFGPVYSDPKLDGKDEAGATNQQRYNLLAEQLRIYDKYSIHWSIWLYKDIGLQGMVHASGSSLYMKTIASFLAKKRQLQIDAWGRRPSTEVEAVINPLVQWIERNAPESKDRYPTPWATERQVSRLVLQIWLAGSLSDEFARLFEGKSLDELNSIAKSFSFAECVQRDGLNMTLEEHARLRLGKEDLARDQVEVMMPKLDGLEREELEAEQ
jgi:hypothetical protein